MENELDAELEKRKEKLMSKEKLQIPLETNVGSETATSST